MNTFTKMIVGAGAIAAIALTAAAPASAATASDRLEGPVRTTANANGLGVPTGVGEKLVIDTSATTWTVPAVGSTGSIKHKDTGLCLSLSAPTEGGPLPVVTTEVCDGSAAQTWTGFPVFTVGIYFKNAQTTTSSYWLNAETSNVPTPGVWAGVSAVAAGATTGGASWALAGLNPIEDEAPAPLTAKVDSVDQANKAADVSGTGEPGATITITGPNGPITTIVDENGNWGPITVPGLSEGENTIPVTQTIDGVVSDPIDLTVIIDPLETPVINPLIAGGAGALALAAAGSIALIRRKKTATQA